MLEETAAGLYCPGGDFHIDPWAAVPRAVITHAHGDHARPGSGAYLCADPGAALLRRRLAGQLVERDTWWSADAPKPAVPVRDPAPGEAPPSAVSGIAYGERLAIGDVIVSLHPAGHVLGSAQIRIEGQDGVWVVSGDYKRAADPTCAPFELVPCDTFITESTFGLPIYRWDRTETVVAEIADWWRGNERSGVSSVLFCYTLGKAQRLLAELTRYTDRPVLVHGMMLGAIDDYRQAGVTMLPTKALIERPRGTSLAGELVLAPLSARGTPWMKRLGDLSDGFVSGLMRVRGVRRQRAYDRGFVLSDHADWPDLLSTIAETGARRVFVSHGHAEPLARYLGERGIESRTMRTAWEGETGSQADEGA